MPGLDEMAQVQWLAFAGDQDKIPHGVDSDIEGQDEMIVKVARYMPFGHDTAQVIE